MNHERKIEEEVEEEFGHIVVAEKFLSRRFQHLRVQPSFNNFETNIFLVLIPKYEAAPFLEIFFVRLIFLPFR